MSRTTLIPGLIASVAVFVSGCGKVPDAALYHASASTKGLPFEMTVSEVRRTAVKSYLEIPGFNDRTSQQARWSMCAFTDLAVKRGFKYWAVVYPSKEPGQEQLVMAFSNSERASPAELLGSDYASERMLDEEMSPVDVLLSFCKSEGYL